MTDPAISIITGTKDRPESFARFLKSLVAHTELPHEVIIADASEGQQYVWEPKPALNRIRWVRIHEKPALGTLKGYNAAFREARAPLCVWLNDDVELLSGWDREAVAQMDARQDIGMGIIYFRDKDHNGWKAKYEIQSYFDVPVPNFAIVRRDVGNAHGWFDESLGRMYGCDTDIGLSFIVKGYGVMPLWGCRILHHREMDQQRRDNLSRIREDRKPFEDKWRGRKEEVKEAFRPWVHLLKPSTCE